VKISVIIPVKNRADIIKETINSVISTKYPDLEIIIIDNNSKDNLADIVSNYKNVKYIKNDDDRERSYSRNIGIKVAKGEFVTFLDSDDLLKKEIFESFKNSLNMFRKDEFFFINYDYKKKNINIKNSNIFKKKYCTINDLVKSNCISNIGIFIKRELALKNLWDENNYIIGTEDYDFVLRLMIKINRAVLIRKIPLAYVRLHDGRSVFNDKETNILKRFFFFKRKLFQDYEFKNLSISYKKKIISTQSLYSSLLLLNCGDKKKSFFFLLISIKKNLLSIFSKRFFYIIFRLLFKK
jgi:teichuronic acid biosynthesis glycosyltransferase TuaG